MKTKRKVIYSAPLTQTLNVVQEGVICTSGDTETFTPSSDSYGDGDFS
ncbi:MAG: hypothetical protein IJK74_07490 [Bacteroidales bacterium]|nr:hypothetical protein [Bacteroidales bacterium]